MALKTEWTRDPSLFSEDLNINGFICMALRNKLPLYDCYLLYEMRTLFLVPVHIIHLKKYEDDLCITYILYTFTENIHISKQCCHHPYPFWIPFTAVTDARQGPCRIHTLQFYIFLMKPQNKKKNVIALSSVKTFVSFKTK